MAVVMFVVVEFIWSVKNVSELTGRNSSSRRAVPSLFGPLLHVVAVVGCCTEPGDAAVRTLLLRRRSLSSFDHHHSSLYQFVLFHHCKLCNSRSRSVVVGYCPLVSLFAADVAAADSDSSPVSTTDARRCCVVAAVQSKVLQCRRHHRAAAAGVALCHRLPAVSPSLSRSALAAHCCCCSEPGDAAVARPDSPYRVGAHAGASACRLAAARRRQLLCRRFAVDPSGSFSVIAAGRCRCSRCSVAAGRRYRSPILRRTPRGVTAVRKQNSLLLSTPRPRCAIAVGVPLSKGLKSSSHQPLPHSFLPSPLGFLLSKLDV
ncbi:uncharacterized protein LOC121774192 [Salvia splendens]|uniref:uncharacterized protein LOC121774192 n=1 Tax=Salvia splendens TaxID=180675 RepID=UPI001C274DA1|nr:uncharacterized protein LOC121774192 [Salvia splendens]